MRLIQWIHIIALRCNLMNGVGILARDDSWGCRRSSRADTRCYQIRLQLLKVGDLPPYHPFGYSGPCPVMLTCIHLPVDHLLDSTHFRWIGDARVIEDLSLNSLIGLIGRCFIRL